MLQKRGSARARLRPICFVEFKDSVARDAVVEAIMGLWKGGAVHWDP